MQRRWPIALLEKKPEALYEMLLRRQISVRQFDLSFHIYCASEIEDRPLVAHLMALLEDLNARIAEEKANAENMPPLL